MYDSGTVDGIPFYVMPFVEGESLRHRLHTGPLPIGDALRIAIEVADALRYAHAHGVVHRDIKPENILLEAGHAVVADFGVAVALSPLGDDPEPGAGLVGTPDYISPEQASGDIVVDGRTDLYALACMLYEMLAGVPPFRARTVKATIARRFLGPPVPLRQRRPEVPEALAEAVEKGLTFDPAGRFSSAADFEEALAAVERRFRSGLPIRSWRSRGITWGGSALVLGAMAFLAMETHGQPARLDPRRVVVAALSNETGDSALAPMGQQVASWITDRLAGTTGIAVVTSATVVPAQHDLHLALSDADDPARLHELAAETRAGTLISGSYYRGVGGSIEFHLEITDANSGRLLRAIGPVTTGSQPERTAVDLGRMVGTAIESLLRRRA